MKKLSNGLEMNSDNVTSTLQVERKKKEFLVGDGRLKCNDNVDTLFASGLNERSSPNYLIKKKISSLQAVHKRSWNEHQ